MRRTSGCLNGWQIFREIIEIRIHSFFVSMYDLLLQFGRKTNMTIFSKIRSSWKKSLELIECISKNMSDIDLVRFVTNMFWWLLPVFLAILHDRNSSMPRGCAAPTNTSTGRFFCDIVVPNVANCCISKVLHTHLKGVQASPAMSEVDCVQGFLATGISLLTSSLEIWQLS